jgi:hypothetical protein
MAEKRKMRPSLRGLAEGYPVRHAGNANSRQRRLDGFCRRGFRRRITDWLGVDRFGHGFAFRPRAWRWTFNYWQLGQDCDQIRR